MANKEQLAILRKQLSNPFVQARSAERMERCIRVYCPGRLQILTLD